MKTSMKTNARAALTRQAILDALRRNKHLLDRRSVRKIGLFGSYAVGRPRAGSDIDLLVEFDRPTFDNFMGLVRDLEKLFGRKVEVLTPEGLDNIRVRSVADSIRRVVAYV